MQGRRWRDRRVPKSTAVGRALAEKAYMVPKWFHEHHRQEYPGPDLSGDEAGGEKEEAESQCRDHSGAGNRGRRSGAATATEQPPEGIGSVCRLLAAAR